MATQTTVLDLTKPAGNENALISVINGNMDKVDAEAGKVRGNVAADYSTSSAYAVGALCIHDGNLYSCNTAIGSGGEAWTAAHWTQVTIAGEIAGVAADIPEVVDNLTTTSSTKALSAGQGKALSDQISTVGTWVLTGEKTAQNTVTVPNTWQEINVLVKLGNNDYRCFTFHIVRGQIGSNAQYMFRDGYYESTGNNAFVEISFLYNADLTVTINLNKAVLTGTDYTSSSVTLVKHKNKL